jgi:hypothetical protein
LLIAATAKLYKSDIVLTIGGGFGELCQKLGVDYHVFTGNADDFIANPINTKILDFKWQTKKNPKSELTSTKKKYR